MHHHYADIRRRIPEEPVWFDEFAVPRYMDFQVCDMANVYCDEVILMRIACQDCGRTFDVCMSSLSSWERMHGGTTVLDRVRTREIHYGDPPNVECCPAGPTMNCVDLEILEAWRRLDATLEWERVAELEVTLTRQGD